MVLNVIPALYFFAVEKFFAGCCYIARERRDILFFGIFSVFFEILAVCYTVMIIIRALGV